MSSGGLISFQWRRRGSATFIRLQLLLPLLYSLIFCGVTVHSQAQGASDPCSSNPCNLFGVCTSKGGQYKCKCYPGFTGVNCEIVVDECASTPCVNGQCRNLIGRYACTCNPGFAGINCDRDINECESSPCQNNGTCTDLLNGYTCSCPDEFRGANCSIRDDGCASSPCYNNATCHSSHGLYNCSCLAGFYGSRCENKTDECLSSPCVNNGTCVSLVNSFLCVCPRGYGGINCSVEIDHCSSSPCQNNGTCNRFLGEYNCSCPIGITGLNCETIIDNCQSDPCQNGANCTNGINSYSCNCVPGFVGIHCETNFDECASNPCQNYGTCIDEINGYSCKCSAVDYDIQWYEYYEGVNCEIICFPQPNYARQWAESRKCQLFAVYQCPSYGAINCYFGSTCIQHDNAMWCICTPGYTGRWCQHEINECESNPCVNNATCIDKVNGYVCDCPPGYTGPLCETVIQACASQPCQNGGTCVQDVSTFRCKCAQGYYGTRCQSATLIVIGTIFPAKGPIEGGSRVIIHISNMQLTKPESVTITSTIVTQILSYNSTEGTIVIKTPPVDTSFHGLQNKLNIKMSGSSVNYPTEFTFTYYAHPVITAIQPLEYVHFGGIRLTVYGTGMDIALTPVLNVTTVTRKNMGGYWIKNSAIYLTNCTEVYPIKAICILPPLSLTGSIAAKITALENAYNNVTDSERHQWANDTVNAMISQGYFVDDSNNTLHVYVGLAFDGNNVQYMNLADSLDRNGTMVVVPSPIIELNKMKTYRRDFFELYQYSIRGFNLFRGMSFDDVSVFLENYEGVVHSIVETAGNPPKEYINCVLRTTYQLPHDYVKFGNACPNKESYHVTVQVGYKTFMHACIREIAPCVPDPCRNGGSCIEGFANYTCSCTDDYYGVNCTEAYPVVAGILPMYGPVAGFSLVSIDLRKSAIFTVNRVFLGDIMLYTLNEVSNTSDGLYRLSVMTPPVAEPANLTVTVEFSSTTGAESTKPRFNRTAPWLYSFRPNPIVVDVYPLDHIYSGGTVIDVTGFNFDSVASPRLSVQMDAISAFFGRDETKITTVYSSDCTVASATHLVCPVPTIHVPQAFIPLLNKQPYNATEDYGTVLHGGVQRGLNYFGNFTVDFRCPNPYFAYIEPLDGSSIEFYAGLSLDGLSSYSGKQWRLTIYPPPVMCHQTVVPKSEYYFSNNSIQKMGKYLLRGVRWQDYTAQVEDVPCTVIGIKDNYLQVKPVNNTLPTRIDVTTSPPCPKDFPFRLFVTVAGEQRYFAACIQYNDTITVDPCENFKCNNGGTCRTVNDAPVCECNGFFGERCEYDDPQRDNFSFSPLSGPLAGGTLITVRGRFHKMLRIAFSFSKADDDTNPNTGPSAQMNNVTVPPPTILFRNETVIVVATKPWYDPNKGSSSCRSMNFAFEYVDTNADPLTFDKQFKFCDNPRITGMRPLIQMLSGGSVLHIFGTDMNASSTVNMTVTVLRQGPVNSRGIKPPPFLSYYPTTKCSIISANVVDCIMPPTDTAKGNIRGKRSPEEGDPVATAAASGREPQDDDVIAVAQRRKRRDATDTTLSVDVTLQFDGFVVEMSKALPNVTMELREAPIVFKPSSVIPYFPYRNQTVEVQGRGLVIVASEVDDYVVRVGGRVVSSVSVRDDRIIFMPPDNVTSLVNITRMSKTLTVCSNSSNRIVYYAASNASATYLIQVSVGYVTYDAGCLQYVTTLSSPNDKIPLGLMIGIPIGGFLFVFLVIFTVVFTSKYMRRWRRNKLRSEVDYWLLRATRK